MRATPPELRQAVHDNLQHLGLDALDVVNLRVGGIRRPEPGSIAEPFGALAELQQQGLIRHLGLSTVNAEQLAEAQSIAPVVCVQNFYNIAHRDDDALLDSLAAQGIAYVPYFPLGGFSPLQSERARRGGGATRRDADGGRPGLAAAAFAEHPADSGHVFGRAPARERRRSGPAPPRGRADRTERHRRLSTALPGLPARVIESKDPITRFRAMNRFRSAPQASPSMAHEPMKLWSKCLMITRGRIEQPHGKTAHGKILCRANGIINVAICRVGLLVPEPIDGHGQELRCFVEVMSDMGCRGAVDTSRPGRTPRNQSRMLSGHEGDPGPP